MNFKGYFSINFLKRNWILLLILSIAAALRLYRIDQYMVFLGDQGRDMLITYNILHGHLTLLGPTSSVGGFFLGPIYYYLVAPFLLLSGFNPAGPSAMVALFSVATVFLIYLIGKRIFNQKVGLISAFLYAISPTVIINSRSSWNPNVMPFFTIITLYSLFLGLTKKNKWPILLCGFLYGITMQLHYIETFLSVIIFSYVLLFHFFQNRKGAIKNSIVSYGQILLGFLIGFSPFILFEIRHRFTNSLNILNFIFHSKDTGAGAQILTNIWKVFLRLFGGITFNYPKDVDLFKFDHGFLQVWLVFSIVVSLAAITLFVKKIYQDYKEKNNVFLERLLILLWLFFGIFLFAFYKKPVYDYYLEFIDPLPFLLIGYLILTLFTWKNKFYMVKILSIAIFAVAVFFSAYLSPILIPPNQQLNEARRISNFVLDKTDGRPFNFALMSTGNSDHAFRFFFKLAGRDPQVIEFPGIDPQRKTVTSQLLIICDRSIPCGPLGYSLWEIAGFGRAQISGHWKEPLVDVFRLTHYSGKEK